MLQMLRSLCRQLVRSNVAICGRNVPLGFHQRFLEKSLERRIERSLFNLKQIVRRSLDVLRERIAVERLPLYRSENHHLQRTWKKVSLLAVFHGWEVLSRRRL